MDSSPPSHRRGSLFVAGASEPPAGGDQGTEGPRSRQQRLRDLGADGERNRDSSDDELAHGTLVSDFSDESEILELDELDSDDNVEDDEETGLTAKERRRRRRRMRRNTRIDERIIGDLKVTKEEEKEADQSVLKRSIVNVALIGLWYTFSLSISIYNKWMFSPDHLDFHFPLFTTSMHMLVQFSLASLILYLFPRFRPQHSNAHRNGPNPRLEHDNKKPVMTKWFYVSRIGPCGVATGLDIGLGNMSLKFITLAFYTMCKSSSLAFVLMFAFLFHLESPSIKLVLIIATMTAGVVMMVAGEAAFNLLGFTLVITAAFASGFRWALTQILLLRNPATGNPFSSIFFLAPVMFISLIAIAIPVEGPGPLFQRFSELVAKEGIILGSAMLIFPGVIAFLMTSSEFALLQRTSVVTLSICGIFKEVITISAAAIVFHDPLTPVNLSGLLITIISIAAYNYIKIKKMRQESVLETVISHQHGEHRRRDESLRSSTGSRDWYAPVTGEEIQGHEEEIVDGDHDLQAGDVNIPQPPPEPIPRKGDESPEALPKTSPTTDLPHPLE
ncbi:MAG: Triose-phosphate Transporter [Geoglossum simile]|nr:MAG: Triose-phosphate Transporter [Geoglossum simile]